MLIRNSRLHFKRPFNGRIWRYASSTASPAPLKTFSNQSKLPRLPIPTLEETASKYLASLQPLLSKEEYAKSEKIVKDFIAPGGQGEKLQQRLIEYDKTQKNSWLELIWLDKAYLEWPDPIMINVNWWLQFRDSEVHQALLKNPPPKGEYSSAQVSRAAGIVSNLLDFKDLIEQEQLPPETMGKKKIPLCMNQYKMQFSVTRIPGLKRDSIRQEFPSSARHIILMLEDQIYKVEVLGKNNQRLKIGDIEKQINAAIELHKSLADKRQAAVGLLTSENRHVWADLRLKLLKMGNNKDNFECIEKSLFAVCLEDFSTSTDIDISHRVTFHGMKGRNRWFDKSFSFILMNNGRGGCNGEHSPSDAVIPGQIIEYIMKREPAKDPSGAQTAPLHPPEQLQWQVNDEILKAIEKAEERAEKDIADIDSVLLHFHEYGGNKIKTQCKISPDAFVQMALQLAYYRTYRKPCATYESASVRQFLHGRTETIRSCSNDSVAFTKAFENDAKKEHLIELLKKATDTHVKYAIDATNGRGVDRHLLGLRMMLAAKEEAEIFKDPAYLKSMYFQLSSSNVSPGDYYYGGFGPVTANGYGINYAIGADMLKFSISSRRHSKDTCSSSFRKILEGSLQDLMKLFV